MPMRWHNMYIGPVAGDIGLRVSSIPYDVREIAFIQMLKNSP
ncbi:hypothetical protein O9H85_28350 [Paenibacillus filicis]|uniref:Uncharacterized protein n=1 Tax=Paenibacillus gyeongsangnamensis TaxID=3388067 RepID=A0ABT4QH66_9BACL|nr:hypothetical protein [Paenibacillus filicis]MCZ8516237.1 hypothetical protein [Paenibacillus filicis]